MDREPRNKSTGVSRRYASSLKTHLARGPRASLRPAGAMGRQAVAAGLATSDLVKIHEQALIRLVSPDEISRTSDGKIARAATFFMEALRPFDSVHPASAGKNGHLNLLNGTMRRKLLELTGARRNLKRELGRRKSLETALRNSERHYGRLLKSSRRVQEHLRRLSREILSAQEQERKRISRELHDEIGQTLTAINVKLATLKREATVSAKGFRKAISSTQRLVEKSMSTIHRFARELRPPLLDDLGLIPALHALMRGFTRRTGVPVRFTAFAAVERLDSDRRTVLYRVAQEAFSNIAKHAHASLVNVGIRKAGKLVRMEIHDNGRSFEVERLLVARKIDRLGLLGMRERVEMVGGQLEVDSGRGRGTTIRAVIAFGRRVAPVSAQRPVTVP